MISAGIVGHQLMGVQVLGAQRPRGEPRPRRTVPALRPELPAVKVAAATLTSDAQRARASGVLLLRKR